MKFLIDSEIDGFFFHLKRLIEAKYLEFLIYSEIDETLEELI